MKKINFVNNDAPYLSAENLNQMQDNIEDAINENHIELLAENIGNGNITVDLSKSVNNYKFISLVGSGYGWNTTLTIPVKILKLVAGNFYSNAIAENYRIKCAYVNETQLSVEFETNLSSNKIYGLK